jgi:hypothetical protein
MLHDAAYAPGGESARKIQPPTRPSLGTKSSLDFKIKPDGMDGARVRPKEKPVTTKPAKRKKQPQQMVYEEQEHQEKQERKYSRPILQSRARGSGGPPPRRYALDDLDGMNDEQIYRLLSEDPELHAAAMKAAEQGKWESRSEGNSRKRSTSAPAGSKKSRRSPPKRIQAVQAEKEVPYFQWAFLLALVGLAAFQVYKSTSRSGVKKTRASLSSTPGIKVKGGKQKKIKVKKAQNDLSMEKLDDGLVAKELLEPEVVLASADGKPVKSKSNGGGTAESKKLSNKKKKKSTPSSRAADTNEGKPRQETHVAPENENLKSKDYDLPMNMEVSNEFSSQESDEAWQTVAKSKASTNKASEKSSKSVQQNDLSIIEEPLEHSLKVKQEPDMEQLPDEVVSDTTKTNNGQKAFTCNESPSESANIEIVKQSVSQPESNHFSAIPEKKKKSKKNKKKQKQNTQSVDLPVCASTDDDEALAMQLQQQEENLALAETNGDDVADSAWEEVATKKKKA